MCCQADNLTTKAGMVIVGAFITKLDGCRKQRQPYKKLFTFLSMAEVLVRNKACESMVIGLLLFHELKV